MSWNQWPVEDLEKLRAIDAKRWERMARADAAHLKAQADVAEAYAREVFEAFVEPGFKEGTP